MTQFNALIFDFNGLIVDDEPIHCELFQTVLRDEDITMTEEEYWKDYLGFDDKGLLAAVFEKAEKNLTPKKLKDLITRKNELYFPTLKKKLRFFPGALDFINKAKKVHPLAVVSGALRSEIEFVLKAGDVFEAFEFIISADDTKHGKPDPEGFVMALTRLKKSHPLVTPQTCLVLEDSHAGVEAAHRAGMKVVGFTHTYPREEMNAADWIVDRFDEVEDLLQL